MCSLNGINCYCTISWNKNHHHVNFASTFARSSYVIMSNSSDLYKGWAFLHNQHVFHHKCVSNNDKERNVHVKDKKPLAKSRTRSSQMI